MEFMAGFFMTVPNHLREQDPQAEHKIIMSDMQFMVDADKAGFKYAVVPEHHFLDEYSHISGNAAVLGWLAHATERIHLLSGIMNPLPQLNHPAKVAETVAMLDHISDGRFEFGTGRGAGTFEILAFFPEGTESSETKDAWLDVIGEFPKMWLQETYEGYEGKYWRLPPRPIRPRLHKPSHPPLWYAAGNESSWEMAGRMGLGVMGNSIQSFELAERAVTMYNRGLAECEPIGEYVNNNICAAVPAFVAETEEQAFEWVMSDEMQMLTGLMYRYHDTFPRPAGIPAWPELPPKPTIDDVKALQKSGQLIGTPDQVSATLKRYEDIGVNSIVIGLGQFGDEHARTQLELFEKHIIPALDKDPEFRTDGFRYGGGTSNKATVAAGTAV